MEAAGAAVAKGDRANAERSLRSAILAVEGRDGSQLELATALVRLGALKLEMGGPHEEAERLISRALVISESQLGEGHQDLVILLNDLTRLYLKHAAYAAAEPLLLRLLAIKRSKGEEHPEVATVLASLASVQQALGRHESAEQLWRRVLDIRERTLAPNHFAVATALEHLGETCAARGKLREGLQHFERAQTIRERTLGAEHASVRTSRERIADLQLQASEDSFDSGDSLPEVRRLPSGDHLALNVPTAPVPTPRENGAAKLGSETASLFEFEPTKRPSAESERVVLPPVDLSAVELAAVDTHQPQPQSVPYLNVLFDIKDELENTAERPAVVAGGTGTLFASVGASLRKHRVAATVGVSAMVVLPLVALAMVNARSRSIPNAEWVHTASAARPTLTDSLPSAATVPEISVRPQGSASDTPKERPGSGPNRAADDRSSGRAGAGASEELATISIPNVPQPAVGRLDSVVRALTAPMRAAVESSPTQLTLSPENASSSLTFGPVGKPTRARVIGRVPTPRYPDQLRFGSVSGEVRCRFDVDTLGRPIMSTFSVAGNPHALLVAAVRKVIPEMQFEPARTPWPEAKAIIDKVEMDFRFSPNAK